MLKGTLEYAPSTFEERGAAVAFTTPLLSQTRVRRGERSKLEVLIPSLSEGMGIYVVNWKAVPEMVSMTMHDRYLHELIVKEETCSPLHIRRATMKAARRGLAGPKAAQAARKALEEEEEQKTLTNYLLILAIFRAVGMASPEMLTSNLETEAGQKRTRELMARAAASLKLDPSVLYSRLADIAEVVAPVGLAQSPKPGKLVRCLSDLKNFRESIEGWAADNPSDSAHVATFCAHVAQHTVGIGDSVVGDFHRRVDAMGQLMRDWDAQMTEVRNLAGRMSWLLDGWEYITNAWASVQGESKHQQALTVNEIFRIIPLVPREETNRDLNLEAQKVLNKFRRSVRTLEDWRTGRMDFDAIRRIEQVKARAA